MKLSQYPYVVVRLACTKCSRRGQYRLARLADKYGSEVSLVMLLNYLSGDCKLRERVRPGVDVCGAYYPDRSGAPRPPDLPYAMRPKLRVVGGR